MDSKQHKVIVTGNVDSNTLIRKLEKSGKHAELWSKSSKNNDSNSSQEEQGNQNQNQNPNVDEAQQNGYNTQTPPENPNSDIGNGYNNGQQVKEVRFEANIPASGDQIKPPENNNGSGSGSGGKKKKKKKKGHNGNNNNNNGNCENKGEQQPNGGPQSTESLPPQGPPAGPVYMSPPRHPHHNRVYEYPPAYYAPPPVYAVNCNTAHPSYTASFYSAPPSYSYAYVHQGHDVEPPVLSDWSRYPSSQPSDTFELFSDENPNACSVM